MAKSPELSSQEDDSKQDGPFEFHIPGFPSKPDEKEPVEQSEPKSELAYERESHLNHLRRWLESINKQIDRLEGEKQSLQMMIDDYEGLVEGK